MTITADGYLLLNGLDMIGRVRLNSVMQDGMWVIEVGIPPPGVPKHGFVMFQNPGVV